MENNVSTRRIFLQKGLTLLAVAPTIPTFLDQTVLALSNPYDARLTQQTTGKDGKILVVVQLSGGNDGLSMVIPYGDDVYYQARARISHAAKDILKIDGYLGLHPNLTGLKNLYDNGDLAIVQGVGYPNPNRSHFRSMDIWQSAEPERQQPSTGWLGRYFDNTCPGCDPKVGVAIGDALPLAMEGEKVMPLSFERPDSYRYNGRDKADYLKLNQADLSGSANLPPKQITAGNQLDFLHRTAMDAQLSSEQILRLTAQPFLAGDVSGQ